MEPRPFPVPTNRPPPIPSSHTQIQIPRPDPASRSHTQITYPPSTPRALYATFQFDIRFAFSTSFWRRRSTATDRYTPLSSSGRSFQIMSVHSFTNTHGMISFESSPFLRTSIRFPLAKRERISFTTSGRSLLSW